MDIFAHAAWTNVVFFRKLKEGRERYIAVLFGILPDLASFTPVFVYSIFSRTTFLELIGSRSPLINYASESYNFTHSIVIFAVVTLVVYFIRGRKLYWPMMGWLVHILIDIPSHNGFYETPFLFPISEYKFGGGVSWAHPKFMIINYSLMAIVYMYWFLVLRKNKSKI